jgi:uncharacterized membrane protein
MQSTARVMGHPVHPMIIPYPFAFLSGAAVFDAAAVANGNSRYAQTARHLSNAGMAMALSAAVPGLIDYLTVVPRGDAKQAATRHLISNVSALACFAAATSVRGRDNRPSTAVLALELVGTAMLSLAGWLGGNLVYQHRIGVEEEDAAAERALLTERADLAETSVVLHHQAGTQLS